MDSKIKIAIIICSYNEEKRVSECLDSVLAQTYTNWEAYCVDDGSADSTGEILEAYAARDARIKVLHKENGGIGKARNYAISHIVDDGNTWISFVDADDYIAPNMYADIADVISTSSKDCEYVRLYCQTTKLRKSENTTYMTPPSPQKIGLKVYTPSEYFAKGDVGGLTCNIFVKESVVKENHIFFPEDQKVLEDQYFSIACALHSNGIVLFKNYAYYYYTNPNSQIHSTKRRAEDIVRCMNLVYPMLMATHDDAIISYLKNRYIPNKVAMLLHNLCVTNRRLQVKLIEDIEMIQYISGIRNKVKYMYCKFYKLF
jgi:glycosyltransferase involved in cell wall biosynthesis